MLHQQHHELLELELSLQLLGVIN